MEILVSGLLVLSAVAIASVVWPLALAVGAAALGYFLYQTFRSIPTPPPKPPETLQKSLEESLPLQIIQKLSEEPVPPQTLQKPLEEAQPLQSSPEVTQDPPSIRAPLPSSTPLPIAAIHLKPPRVKPVDQIFRQFSTELALEETPEMESQVYGILKTAAKGDWKGFCFSLEEFADEYPHNTPSVAKAILDLTDLLRPLSEQDVQQRYLDALERKARVYLPKDGSIPPFQPTPLEQRDPKPEPRESSNWKPWVYGGLTTLMLLGGFFGLMSTLSNPHLKPQGPQAQPPPDDLDFERGDQNGPTMPPEQHEGPYGATPLGALPIRGPVAAPSKNDRGEEGLFAGPQSGVLFRDMNGPYVRGPTKAPPRFFPTFQQKAPSVSLASEAPRTSPSPSLRLSPLRHFIAKPASPLSAQLPLSSSPPSAFTERFITLPIRTLSRVGTYTYKIIKRRIRKEERADENLAQAIKGLSIGASTLNQFLKKNLREGLHAVVKDVALAPFRVIKGTHSLLGPGVKAVAQRAYTSLDEAIERTLITGAKETILAPYRALQGLQQANQWIAGVRNSTLGHALGRLREEAGLAIRRTPKVLISAVHAMGKRGQTLNQKISSLQTTWMGTFASAVDKEVRDIVRIALKQTGRVVAQAAVSSLDYVVERTLINGAKSALQLPQTVVEEFSKIPRAIEYLKNSATGRALGTVRQSLYNATRGFARNAVYTVAQTPRWLFQELGKLAQFVSDVRNSAVVRAVGTVISVASRSLKAVDDFDRALYKTVISYRAQVEETADHWMNSAKNIVAMPFQAADRVLKNVTREAFYATGRGIFSLVGSAVSILDGSLKNLTRSAIFGGGNALLTAGKAMGVGLVKNSVAMPFQAADWALKNVTREALYATGRGMRTVVASPVKTIGSGAFSLLGYAASGVNGALRNLTRSAIFGGGNALLTAGKAMGAGAVSLVGSGMQFAGQKVGEIIPPLAKALFTVQERKGSEAARALNSATNGMISQGISNLWSTGKEKLAGLNEQMTEDAASLWGGARDKIGEAWSAFKEQLPYDDGARYNSHSDACAWRYSLSTSIVKAISQGDPRFVFGENPLVIMDHNKYACSTFT